MSLARTPELEPEVIAGLTPAALHAELLRCGNHTILDIFDTLPWYRASASWTAWRAFLCAVYALPMTQQEYEIFVSHTGRREPPQRKVREAWVAVGRRGRKSAIAATIGVYEGAFRDHSPYLAKGERARIIVIAKDKDDAGQIHDFAAAILSEPGLSHLLEEPPIAEKIALTTRCDIMTKAARITAGRSRCVPAALYDELAFWPTDQSANPDHDIIRGVEPGMANVPNPLTLGLSSAYAKRGVLWEKYEKYYGEESDEVLVWNADTLSMHETPAIKEYVELAWKNDPAAAVSEVGQSGAVAFRGDVKKFVDPAMVDLASVGAPAARPPVNGIAYHAFVDPSGGSSDSMTLAIAHWDNTVVLDLAMEWPAPFEPDAVVAAIEVALEPYGVKSVTGDKYGGKWPASRFRARGIQYISSPESKSDLYLSFLPILNSGRAKLLENEVLRKQLTSLDRTEHTGGRDTVDHPVGGHDDVVNAVAGACVIADTKRLQIREVRDQPTTTDEIVRDRFRAMLRPPAPGGATVYGRRR